MRILGDLQEEGSYMLDWSSAVAKGPNWDYQPPEHLLLTSELA
jgi:hypothetical protein